MVLNKRISREFKEKIIKNIVYMLLIILSVALIVGFNRSMDGIKDSLQKFQLDSKVEDGSFRVYGRLDNKSKSNIINNLNISLEENKYFDYNVNKDKLIRVFSERSNVNKLQIARGRKPEGNNEIVLDQNFSKKNNYNIGNKIKVLNKQYKIVGLGTTPDYVYVIKNSDDFLNNPDNFGVGYVTKDVFNGLSNVQYIYSYRLNNGSRSKLKSYINKNYYLMEWLEKDKNSRINEAFDDIKGPKILSVAFGILLVIIVGFIISLSMSKRIKEESSVLGTLYSLGYSKLELLGHYILFPVFISLFGSVVGYIIGIIISKPLVMTEASTYNFPIIALKSSNLLFVYGFLVPLILVIIVNILVIFKALSKSPLKLLNGEEEKINPLEKLFNFEKFSFNIKFRMRELIREMGGILILFIGVFLASVILFVSFYMKDSCRNYMKLVDTEASYKYIYILNNNYNKAKSDGEKTFIKNMYIKIAGEEKAITLQGIEAKSKYYNFKDLEDNKVSNKGIMISKGVSYKYNLHKGDSITLHDSFSNKNYKVIVDKIVDYNNGLYIFMDIASMSKLLKTSGFNAIISNKALKLNKSEIYSTIKSRDIKDSAKNVLNMIDVFAYIMVAASIAIFIIVIYLIMSMIIDKSKNGISLIKVFGYDNKEISKLYLSGNIVVVIIAFVLAKPLGNLVTKNLYDNILENMQAYLIPSINYISIIIAFAICILSFFISNVLIKNSILRVNLYEALKNRE